MPHSFLNVRSGRLVASLAVAGVLTLSSAGFNQAAEDPPAPTVPQELPPDEDDPKPLKRPAKPETPPDKTDEDKKPEGDPAAAKPDTQAPDETKPDGLEHLDPNRKKQNYLDDAIRGMRNAQLKMEAEKGGKDTPDIQQKVIDDLEKLIAEIQQNNSSSSSSSSSSQSRAMKNIEAQRKAQQKQGQGKPQGGEAQQQPQQAGAGGKNQNDSGDSTEDQSERKRAQEEEERRRRLSQDVWGHLPQNVREKLLNTYTERLLPKYEDVVRNYYRALADKKKSSPR